MPVLPTILVLVTVGSLVVICVVMCSSMAERTKLSARPSTATTKCKEQLDGQRKKKKRESSTNTQGVVSDSMFNLRYNIHYHKLNLLLIRAPYTIDLEYILIATTLFCQCGVGGSCMV